jgi:tetratricopeptide (TPR) repeat protein
MLLDEGLETGALAELLVNRAALRTREGDGSGAETDLRAAIDLAPALPPAWANLAVVLEQSGRKADAAQARARFEQIKDQPPRGFPYGVGNGFLYDSGAGQHFMLMLGREGELSLYRPPRARNR